MSVHPPAPSVSPVAASVILALLVSWFALAGQGTRGTMTCRSWLRRSGPRRGGDHREASEPRCRWRIRHQPGRRRGDRLTHALPRPRAYAAFRGDRRRSVGAHRPRRPVRRWRRAERQPGRPAVRRRRRGVRGGYRARSGRAIPRAPASRSRIPAVDPGQSATAVSGACCRC